MARSFVHPENIKFKTAPGSKEMVEHRFAEWMEAIIGSDRRITASLISIRMANRVIDVINATKPGETIRIDDGDFDMIKPIIARPDAFDLNVWFARHLHVWHEIFLGASDDKK